MTMEWADRRRARRRPGEEHRGVSARIRPGHAVRLVDVSTGGALIETARRLLPGACIELQIDTDRRRATLRSTVVRCGVIRLAANAVCYQAALAFDRPLLWFGDSGSAVYRVPPAESRRGESRG